MQELSEFGYGKYGELSGIVRNDEGFGGNLSKSKKSEFFGTEFGKDFGIIRLLNADIEWSGGSLGRIFEKEVGKISKQGVRIGLIVSGNSDPPRGIFDSAIEKITDSVNDIRFPVEIRVDWVRFLKNP